MRLQRNDFCMLRPNQLVFLILIFFFRRGEGSYFVSSDSLKWFVCFPNLYTWINIFDEIREHNIISNHFLLSSPLKHICRYTNYGYIFACISLIPFRRWIWIDFDLFHHFPYTADCSNFESMDMRLSSPHFVLSRLRIFVCHYNRQRQWKEHEINKICFCYSCDNQTNNEGKQHQLINIFELVYLAFEKHQNLGIRMQFI